MASAPVELGRKIVFPDGSAKARQGLEWQVPGMQCLSRLAAKPRGAIGGVDEILLVLLGDGGKGEHLPGLLLEHVACEVVLMQTLHDQNDGARDFVVEPAVERVVVPIVDRLAAQFGERLLGLRLDVHLFRYGQSVIDFDPEIANGALDLGVSREQLHGT